MKVFNSVISIMIIFHAVINQGRAFQLTTLITTSQRVDTRGSALNAWSLPYPSAVKSNSFRPLTNIWYDDLGNPTARATVYNDAPEQFVFMRFGEDWPIITETSPVLESVKLPNRKPLRLQLQRIVRVFRRGTSQRYY